MTFEMDQQVYPTDKNRNFDIGRVKLVGPRDAVTVSGYYSKESGVLSYKSDGTADVALYAELDRLGGYSDFLRKYEYRSTMDALTSDQVAVQWGGCGCGGNGPRIENASELTVADATVLDNYWSDIAPEGHSFSVEDEAEEDVPEPANAGYDWS